MTVPKLPRTLEPIIEVLILGSRWLLAPLYLGLALVLGIIVIKAAQEVIHLYQVVLAAKEADLVVSILGVVDLVLVANLLVMIVMSSYETFVSRIDASNDDKKPTWLGKLDPGTIKIKLAVSVVAVSSVHLLQIFINLGEYSSQQLLWYTVIHLTFVMSGLLMAFIDKIAFSGHRE
ncbi:MAG: TIGR00645 family protein [Gammaproteobacteria bacterium]